MCMKAGLKAELTCRQQDAVVEQQGELIRFLQRRCDNLAREVLHLQAREDRWHS